MRRLMTIAAALALLGPLPTAAKTVTVKLASLAPNNSIWDQAVKEMGADWKEATDGRVLLRVYAGGVAGDEPAVVRKMRIGQLQAAVLTPGGLADIDPAFGVFVIPFLFDSYDELYHVLGELTPMFRDSMEKKGYVLLNWGNAGWVHLFSAEPVRTVDDLRKIKLYIAAGDDDALQWWKNGGFKPVPLATTDILTSLQTGLVDALPSPPLAALLLQWYKNAPNMLDIGFAPLVGGTVISAKVWKQIPEDDRAALLGAAARVEERLETDVPGQDRESIAEMEKRGLTVVHVEGTAAAAGWRDAAEAFAERVKDSRVPPEILRRVLAVRDAYRASQAAAGGTAP